MGLFKGLEKGVKKIGGFLTGGEPRGVGELKRTGEISGIAQQMAARAAGKEPAYARLAGKAAGQQAQRNIASQLASAKGVSAGLKSRMALRQGKEAQADIASQTLLAEALERQQALKDAGTLYSGLQQQELAREGLISQADAAKRQRRQQLIGGLIEAGGSYLSTKARRG